MGANTSTQVLILGDGNYSFTYALAKKHPGPRRRNPGPPNACHITATSYDDEFSLRMKYREFPLLKEKIQAQKCVSFRFGVDATQLDTTLRAPRGVAGASDIGTDLPEKFHHIIFNHPHSGVEDMHRHRSLLGHFLHSARPWLLPDIGRLYLTFLKSHTERWNLYEIAKANGYLLVESYPFPFDDYPEFEHKRHQGNTGFKGFTDGDGSFTYVFRIPDINDTTDHNDTIDYERVEEADALLVSPDGQSHQCTICLRSWKTNAAWLEHVQQLRPVDPPLIRCQVCHAHFPTERGLKQHLEAVIRNKSPDQHRRMHLCTCRAPPGTQVNPTRLGGCPVCTGCFKCSDIACRPGAVSSS